MKNHPINSAMNLFLFYVSDYSNESKIKTQVPTIYLYQISINRGKMTITQGGHCKPCSNSLLSSLSLLVKNFEEEIQLFEDQVETARG